MSFDVKGGREAAWRVVDTTRLLSITANLGDTKTHDHASRIHHARAHHAGSARRGGHRRGLLRVAVGLEAIEDIKADLARGPELRRLTRRTQRRTA